MPTNIYRAASSVSLIDDDAFDTPSESLAVDAFILKKMAEFNNALVLSGQQIMNLIWPTQGESEVGGEAKYSFWGPKKYVLADRYVVPKKPYLRTATMNIRHRVDSNLVMHYGIGTKNNPLPTTLRSDAFLATNTASAAGTGDWATVNLTGIPIDPGMTEEISVVAWTTGDAGVETDTGTYGTPLHGATSSDPFLITYWWYSVWDQDFRASGIMYTGSAWNAALADGQHSIVFTDSGGTRLTAPHLITAVNAGGSNNVLAFTPHLDSSTFEEVRTAGGGTGYAQIIYQPRVELACITMVADEVSASAV